MGVNPYIVLLALGLLAYCGVESLKVQRVEKRRCLRDGYNDTIYDYSLRSLKSNTTVPLSLYRGKVVLIVNVATFWGFTPHYIGLSALQAKFGNNLAILGIPCNQFGLQEPGSNATEIYNGLRFVRPGHGFVPNFQLFQKIDVNGEKEHPLYTFLKSVCVSTRDGFGDLQELYWSPLKNWDVRWNFEKFLIDPWGKPYMRYDPSAEPISKITSDIEAFTHTEF